MTPNELLVQADKYRAMAALLPPNLPPPQNKDYYLRRAVELEQQAQMAVARAPATCTEHPQTLEISTIAPVMPAAPAITLRKQTRVHSNLAVELFKAKQVRPYTIWATLRHAAGIPGRVSWVLKDVVTHYSKITGNTERAVRLWIDQGEREGAFWSFSRNKQGQRVIDLHSRSRVFDHFLKGASPGEVQFIATDKLLAKSFKQVNAYLHNCWINKESKFAKRKTITDEITGASRRAQQNYDRITGQKKEKLYTPDIKIPNKPDKPFQLPNRYYRMNATVDKPQQHYKQRRGLYPQTSVKYGHNAGASQDVTTGARAKARRRYLYDNAVRAVRAQKQRQRSGETGIIFVPLENDITKPGRAMTRRGKQLVKVFAYGL